MRSLILASSAIVLAVSACGASGAGRDEPAGPSVARSYTVGSFDKIEVAGPYEVTVTTGTAASVRASGPDNLIEKMVVEIEGNTLKIHPQKQRGMNFGWSRGHKVALQVTVPSLRAAEIAGSSEISIDKVTGERFEGGIAGSGDLKLGRVDVGSLELGIAGSGGVTAAGKAASAKYEIAGSGDIDAAGLVAERADVSIAGSGNVAANASAAAAVSIMGSGDVTMTGGGKCTVSKHGSGNVNCG